MAIYDNLPYTNFHELNADWLLKQMKEAKAKIDEYQETLDQFEEDYNVLLGLASAMTVAGSNVTVAGSLTANGLIGNLTGNVTGNVTGNASTATHATSADSATNATNATNADRATLANSASEANVAKSVGILTTISSHDMNDFVNSSPDKLVAFYNGTAMTTNVPTGWENDDVTVMVITFKSTIIVQIAMFSSTPDLFVRTRVSGTWGQWNAIAFDV